MEPDDRPGEGEERGWGGRREEERGWGGKERGGEEEDRGWGREKERRKIGGGGREDGRDENAKTNEYHILKSVHIPNNNPSTLAYLTQKLFPESNNHLMSPCHVHLSNSS